MTNPASWIQQYSNSTVMICHARRSCPSFEMRMDVQAASIISDIRSTAARKIYLYVVVLRTLPSYFVRGARFVEGGIQSVPIDVALYL